MKKDFGKHIESLGTEKYRSIIIHHDSFSAMKYFAQSATDKYGGKYWDLLDYFKDNPEISVDVFDVEELEILMKKLSSGHPFLCIDKINFLLDTWSRDEKTSFYGLIRNVWNSFYKDSQATLVFFIHTFEELEQQKITDSSGNSRIHLLSSFEAIH
ncbi:hypothetical protein ACFL7M_07670 [Thermodesulfobacteriota bacterium]